MVRRTFTYKGKGQFRKDEKVFRKKENTEHSDWEEGTIFRQKEEREHSESSGKSIPTGKRKKAFRQNTNRRTKKRIETGR
jgi:hypothetical protein